MIFDLEDSVAPAHKADARKILKALPARTGGPQWWVRINPLGSEHIKADLGLFASADFEGVVLPKAEGGADVAQLAHRTGNLPVHAIVTETAGKPVRNAVLPRPEVAAGGDELGRGGSVGGAWRILEI